jgi:hypothetical protein
MRHLRTVMNITNKFIRDTEEVKNAEGAGAGLDLADEFVFLASSSGHLTQDSISGS